MTRNGADLAKYDVRLPRSGIEKMPRKNMMGVARPAQPGFSALIQREWSPVRRDRFVDSGGAFLYRGNSATKRSRCHTSTS